MAPENLNPGPRNIPEAFRQRVAESPDALAYREFQSGEWQDVSWGEVARRVERRRVALASSGLHPGDRVGIFLNNNVDWVVSDLAAMSQGLVTVPVYTRDSAANICHVLRDSGASLCVTDTVERWNSLGEQAENLPDLREVWLLNDHPPHDSSIMLACPEPTDGDFVEHEPDASIGELATIVYTSGTTGLPKGVMLSHRGLLSNANAVLELHPIRSNDLFLSVLPLAHGFERTLGYLAPLIGGGAVAFTRSIQDLGEDLKYHRPTMLLAVPRLFEKVHARAIEAASNSPLRRHLLSLTERVGIARAEAMASGKQPALLHRLFWALVGRHIASKIRDAFGGRLRIVLSGGAPMPKHTLRFFTAMEFPLIEGYGLTEAGPAVTGRRFEENRLGSVGHALPGTELRIGEKDELLVRARSNMLGYWNNPEATAGTLDADGWLHTGDVAEIIDGWVIIRARLKDILVLSTGENVNPVPIEAAALSDQLVEQASVVGDGYPGCVAVAVVDKPAFEDWLRKENCVDPNPEGDEAAALLHARLLRAMQDIPPFARIRGVVVETKPWSLSSGLITPTLKAKRNKVAEAYADRIGRVFDAG